MQDRFKFRSFGRPNSIIEGMQNIYTFEETENGYANVKVEKGWLAFVEKENLKIMQCTGLKDKNGKLIYEGDIVKITKEDWKQEISHRFYIICWDRTQWQLGLIKYQRPKAQPNRRPDRKAPFKNIVSFADCTPLKEFARCEIIGNIYENPELLKDGEV